MKEGKYLRTEKNFWCEEEVCTEVYRLQNLPNGQRPLYLTLVEHYPSGKNIALAEALSNAKSASIQVAKDARERVLCSKPALHAFVLKHKVLVPVGRYRTPIT